MAMWDESFLDDQVRNINDTIDRASVRRSQLVHGVFADGESNISENRWRTESCRHLLARVPKNVGQKNGVTRECG